LAWRHEILSETNTAAMEGMIVQIWRVGANQTDIAGRAHAQENGNVETMRKQGARRERGGAKEPEKTRTLRNHSMRALQGEEKGPNKGQTRR
jgi:hypothetical protein